MQFNPPKHFLHDTFGNEKWFRVLHGYADDRYDAIEKRLMDTFRYVACDANNALTFSYEYSSLLRDIGSVIDTIMDRILRNTSTNPKEKYNMGDYRIWLKANIPEIDDLSIELVVNRTNVCFIPFVKISESATLDWWEAYTNVKHSDLQYFRSGNLGYVLKAMACLATLFILMDSLEDNDAVFLFAKLGYRTPKEELEQSLFLP